MMFFIVSKKKDTSERQAQQDGGNFSIGPGCHLMSLSLTFSFVEAELIDPERFYLLVTRC